MSSSAKRALKVLELVAASPRPLGVTEIARMLEQPAGTVFRTLDALQKSSYADRYLHSSRYVLGPASFRLRHSLFAGFKIRDAALPFLRQAASTTGETASLIVPVGWYGVRIASARGSNEVSNAPPLGVLGPLSDHYASRVILAYFPSEPREAYRDWARRSGAPEVCGDLTAIAERGYAEEDGALAFPVMGAGDVLAALAIEGPVYRGSAARGREIVAQCREIARAIEAIVGARPAAYANPFAHIDPGSIVFEQKIAAPAQDEERP
jgi:DNA-binding IclR family transcriptional regulator